MTKGKKLLVLTAVLLLMAGACFAVTKLMPEETTTAKDTAVTVLQLEESAITGISWTYEGQTMDFILDGENWTYASDTTFPVKSGYLTKMVDRLSHVTASKVFENVEDLAQYGLDEPVMTIRVTTTDAEEPVVLTLGDTTELSQEYYMTPGDGKVYLASTYFYNSFAYSLYDIVEKETIPSMANVNKVVVSTDAGREITIEGTEKLNTFAEALSGISWGDCVEYKADSESLAGYGLENPDFVFTIHYTKTTEAATEETDEEGNVITETLESAESFTLEMSKNEDGTCYAHIPGSGMVYTMDSTIYEAAETLIAE